MSRLLTDDELARITGARRRTVQARRLAELRIPYRLAYDGRPLVLLSALSPAAPVRARARLEVVR